MIIWLTTDFEAMKMIQYHPSIWLNNIATPEIQARVDAFTFYGLRISDWETNEGTIYSMVTGTIRIAVKKDK